MSRRNTPEAKKLRALHRALRKGRLPASIDLIHYLKLHGRADTTGEATRILNAGRVKADSHTLGSKRIDGEWTFWPYAPASMRDSIVVLDG